MYAMRTIPHGGGIVLASLVSATLWAVAILLSSCTFGAFDQVSRFRYKGMNVRIVVAPQSRVDKHCRNLAHRRGQKHYLSDSGQVVQYGDARGCADQAKRIIWVGEGNEDIIPHELCHLEHADPAECDGVHVK